MSGVLIEIQSVPGNPRKLVLTMTDDGLDISGVSFRWAEIDRVKYSAVDRHLNGAYMGTTFAIEVGNAAKRRMRFALDSGTTGALKSKVDEARRDRNQSEWTRAVEILESRVCVRLAHEAVATVRRGGVAELGGLRLDDRGVHKPGVFSKSVAWPDVAGTAVKHPYFQVTTAAGGPVRKALEVPNDGWNVVLLARVINALRQPT